MPPRSKTIISVLVLGAVGASATACPAEVSTLERVRPVRADEELRSLADDSILAGCLVIDDGTGAMTLDAACFFDQLVRRYRGLETYLDTTHVVQVTTPKDGPAKRVDTRLEVEVRDGGLRVETPQSQARRAVTRGIELDLPDEVKAARRRHELWMAPHMALKYADDPAHLRPGVDQEYTASRATAVTVDEKAMVHLELRACPDDADPAACATLDLYVDPDSMLVEKVETHESLPDGGDYDAQLEITPLYASPPDPAHEETTPAHDHEQTSPPQIDPRLSGPTNSLG